MTSPLLPGAAPGRLDLGDREVWFEHRAGAGDAILLLHGGLADSRTLGPLLEVLAADDDTADWSFTYYDRRGHGRTADTAAPFGYADMVDEAVAVLERVVGGPAHLVGHSDGANLALLLAAARPDLVRSVTAFSANTHPNGLLSTDVDVPGLVDYLRRTDDGISPDAAGPDAADRIERVVSKIATLWTTEPTISAEQLGGILVPVLVVSADRDQITLEHTIALYRSLYDATLAIVPSASHMLVEEDAVAAGRLALEHIARTRARGILPDV